MPQAKGGRVVGGRCCPEAVCTSNGNDGAQSQREQKMGTNRERYLPRWLSLYHCARRSCSLASL